MQCLVIVGQENGVYRAWIPSFPQLSAEGATSDEAIRNAQKAVEAYLSSVEVATVEVKLPPERTLRPGSPQAVLKAAGQFKGDEEAMLQHIEEIYAERRSQRQEVERELDEADRNVASSEADKTIA